MRPVLIEWVDAIGPVNVEWTALSQVNRKVYPVRVVGFLLHEDEDSVTLVAQVDMDPDPGQNERIASHDMTVPRGCIKRMVDLVEAPPISKSAGGRSAKPSRKGGRSSTGK